MCRLVIYIHQDELCHVVYHLDDSLFQSSFSRAGISAVKRISLDSGRYRQDRFNDTLLGATGASYFLDRTPSLHQLLFNVTLNLGNLYRSCIKRYATSIDERDISCNVLVALRTLIDTINSTNQYSSSSKYDQ